MNVSLKCSENSKRSTQVYEERHQSTHVLTVVHLLTCAGVFVVLDLTPNYLGSSGPWFSNSSVTIVAERLKVSADVTHMLLTAVQLNVPEISVRGSKVIVASNINIKII